MKRKETGGQSVQRRVHRRISISVITVLLMVAVAGLAAPALADGRPSRPTGLRLVRVTGRSVALRWRTSAGAATYRIIRNGTRRANGVRRARFRDGAVTRFTAYSYAVAACNSAGCSGRSTTVTAVTRGGACRGVDLTPRNDLQRAIRARGEGTTFCLSSGKYHLPAPIVPRSHDVIWGARATVLTGGGVTAGALVGYSHYQHDVRIRGLTIERFAGPNAAITAGNHWIVEGNRIAYNGAAGVQAENGSTIRGNYAHHNGIYGLAGMLHLTRATYSHNVVAFNNTKRDLNGAGAKVLFASYVKFIGNYVHDNWGNGLHCDTDCIHMLFTGNRVTGNSGPGIHYETSYTAVIRDNYVAGNDRVAAGRSLFYGSQIRLLDSSGVEVYGNRVVASVRDTNGIGLMDWPRGSGTYGTFRIANDYIHHNVIVLRRGGTSGLVGTAHTPRRLNNRFRQNHYRVARVHGRHFTWGGQPITWRRWRSAGQDRTGSIQSI
jgi:Right handed beta helix region